MAVTLTSRVTACSDKAVIRQAITVNMTFHSREAEPFPEREIDIVALDIASSPSLRESGVLTRTYGLDSVRKRAAWIKGCVTAKAGAPICCATLNGDVGPPRGKLHGSI